MFYFCPQFFLSPEQQASGQKTAGRNLLKQNGLTIFDAC